MRGYDGTFCRYANSLQTQRSGLVASQKYVTLTYLHKSLFHLWFNIGNIDFHRTVHVGLARIESFIQRAHKQWGIPGVTDRRQEIRNCAHCACSVGRRVAVSMRTEHNFLFLVLYGLPLEYPIHETCVFFFCPNLGLNVDQINMV